VVPVSAFYHDGYDPGLVRFCFAKEAATLAAATARLRQPPSSTVTMPGPIG
jgi:methionine aminotransferase